MVADSDGLSVGYRDDSRCARSSSLLSLVGQLVLTLLRLETAHRHVIESSSITEIYLLEEIGRLLVLATNTLYSTILDDLLPSPDPDQWTKVRVLPFFFQVRVSSDILLRSTVQLRKESGETINAWGESVDGFRVGRRDGKLLVVYWCFNRLVGRESKSQESVCDVTHD